MTHSTDITRMLQAAQMPVTAQLWTPADAITFTPQVLTKVFGDGRALFSFGTLISRPAYWIVRADSGWTSGDEHDPDAELFAEHSEEVLLALEEEFGHAECGREYSYNSSGRPYDRETGRFLSQDEINYPVVNARGGWHWGRLDWPKLPGLRFVRHRLDTDVRVLAPEFAHVETGRSVHPSPLDALGMECR